MVSGVVKYSGIGEIGFITNTKASYIVITRVN